VFRNNILAKGPQSVCSTGYGSGYSDSAISFTRNLYYGLTPAPRDSSPMTSNPMFVAPTSNNLRLQSGSPAINASSGSTVVDDFDGARRSSPDLGAYEKN